MPCGIVIRAPGILKSDTQAFRILKHACITKSLLVDLDLLLHAGVLSAPVLLFTNKCANEPASSEEPLHPETINSTSCQHANRAMLNVILATLCGAASLRLSHQWPLACANTCTLNMPYGISTVCCCNVRGSSPNIKPGCYNAQVMYPSMESEYYTATFSAT